MEIVGIIVSSNACENKAKIMAACMWTTLQKSMCACELLWDFLSLIASACINYGAITCACVYDVKHGRCMGHAITNIYIFVGVHGWWVLSLLLVIC